MDSGAKPKRMPNEHLLVTANLRLRATRSYDVDNFVTLLTDAEVMKYIGVEQGRLPSRQEVVQIVSLAVDAWENRGYGRWSIFERDTGCFVGFCGFRCEKGNPELISVVHERFWGSGYAGEASSAAIDYGFASLGFTKIVANTRPTNIKARSLIDRLGFEFKGVIDFHGVEGASFELLKA